MLKFKSLRIRQIHLRRTQPGLCVLLLAFLFFWDHRAAAAQGGRKYRPDRVIVIPKAGVELARARPKGFSRGRKVLKRFPRLGGIEVHQLAPGETVEEALAELRQSGLFEVAEPDYILHASAAPDDPEFVKGTLWGLRNTGQNGGVPGADIAAAAGWDTMRAAPEVVIAVIDSGIRYTHEDLAENMWVNPGEIPGNGRDDDDNGVIDDVHGLNAVTNGGDPMDDNGHGTHVAGIAGAVGNNGKGVSGVAWEVRLMACKFLDSIGDGDTSDAIQCIDYARRNGADIINASFGGEEYSSALYTALANARNAGIIVVAAAGNAGRNIDAIPNYPASYNLDNIVSVGALNRFDALDRISNYGVESVDIAAPGTSIYSTWFTHDRAYTYLSGTSMAAPYVSGAFALLKVRYPEESAYQLIQRLIEAAEPVAALANKCATGGRLNLAGALGPPVMADFGPVEVAGEAPFGVAFTNFSFGEITEYAWDFGDGSGVETNASPEHVFADAGEFQVVLKVRGAEGAVHSKTGLVRVARNYEFIEEPFGWMDISDSEPLVLGDNGHAAVLAGFEFDFYGRTYSAIHVGANGVLGFGTEGLEDSSNSRLPDPETPNALIAPHWDNLDPTAGGAVYAATTGAAPNRKFIASWVGVPKNSNGARLTFQAVLEEGSNEIVLRYLEVQPHGNRGAGRAATVGLQESSGGIAALYSYNGEPVLLRNEMALRARLKSYSYMVAGPVHLEAFAGVAGQPLPPRERIIHLRNAGTTPLEWRGTPDAEWLEISPAAGRLGAGESADVRVSLKPEAALLPAGVHSASIAFENLLDGQGNMAVEVALDMAEARPVLTVVTNQSADFSGGLGGPFTPEVSTAAIRNTGNAPLEWTVASTPGWLDAEPVSGTLTPGGEAVIEFSLSAEAEGLGAGVHHDLILIENMGTGEGSAAIPASLNVRSGLQSQATARLEFGVFKLTIKADPETTQVVEVSTDLVHWRPGWTNLVSAGGLAELWIPMEPGSRFFRIREQVIEPAPAN